MQRGTLVEFNTGNSVSLGLVFTDGLDVEGKLTFHVYTGGETQLITDSQVIRSIARTYLLARLAYVVRATMIEALMSSYFDGVPFRGVSVEKYERKFSQELTQADFDSFSPDVSLFNNDGLVVDKGTLLLVRYDDGFIDVVQVAWVSNGSYVGTKWGVGEPFEVDQSRIISVLNAAKP